MKVFALYLLYFSLVFAASAQAVRQPRNSFANRLARTNNAPSAPAVQPSAASTSTEPGGRSIEFNAAPIDMVFTVYQDLVGKTVLKDPQTPAVTITLQPKKGQELSVEDKIEAIETVLEMNGVHMEPYGEKFMRALPRKDVRKDGIPLIMDPEAKLGESTRVVSLMLPFKNIGVEEAQKALEGFKSNSGILLVFERTNSILVTDTEQIINRMREIAKAIDIASPVTETVEYIQIKYANANEVKQVIDNIVQESMKEQEKNGKAPVNNPVSTIQPVRPPFGGGLLNRNRPGQQNQPAVSVNNPSLVTTVSDADRGMIRGKVVTIADERSNKILIITNAQNMKFFKEVIAALDVETTPDVQVKVYRLKYAEAEDVSDMINDLIGNSASSKDSKGNQNQNSAQGTSGSVTRGTSQAKKPANQRTGESKAGELNKDNVTVLADKRINGLVVMARTEDIPTIEQIIESMDIKLSQVLIETVIIEVRLGDGLETGMDWVQKGRQNQIVPTQYKNSAGQPLFYKQVTTSGSREDGTSYQTSDVLTDLTQLVPEGYSYSYTKDGNTFTETASDVAAMFNKNVLSRTGLMNNWQGATSVGLGGGENGGVSAFNIASGLATNVLGRSFSFVFDSDELGLSAILQAAKNDSHSKYVAAPIIMTLDNKEAKIDATSQKQFLTGWTAQSGSVSGSGAPTPNYSPQDIGIKLTVTPKINPNGTVMLKVEEEYTQVSEQQYMLSPVGSGSSIVYVDKPTDVPSKREMSADVLLENNQTVVFTGLTETHTMDTEDGIPILKDIPFIGKWLFGHVKQEEARVELLVFMTPYVLDDAQAAQAEALRRKKALSDPRPWDDHGWSLSPLADPVSKQEQMRRIKEEWKKQDEERKARIAIEKSKVDRVKQLEKMSKEERELWLKMHKKELDEEAQDELEEKMLDEKSQEELKKLAAQIRKEKLGTAEKAIKAAEDEAAAENERGKLDAEKKAKAAGENKKAE